MLSLQLGGGGGVAETFTLGPNSVIISFSSTARIKFSVLKKL